MAVAGVEHVGARGAGQRVVAGAAAEPVVAVGAGQAVVAAVADEDRGGERVARAAAEHALDARADVVALVARAVVVDAVVVDGDRSGASAVVRGVEARAALEHVGAARPVEQIVARAAVERVRHAAAGQVVVAGAAGDVLDRREGVALGAARGEVGDDRGAARGEVDPVGAGPAVVDVVAGRPR